MVEEVKKIIRNERKEVNTGLRTGTIQILEILLLPNTGKRFYEGRKVD